MANTQSSGSYYSYATVDTAPGAAGWWTKKVCPRQIDEKKGGRDVYFSIRDLGTAFDAVITIQFKCTDGSTADTDWTDYDSTSAVQRQILDDRGAGVFWRAGIKQNDYVSGTVKFGFDW